MKLNFDGQEYEVESMSEKGKLTVKSLQFVEAKTVELSNEADLEPLNNVTE